MCTTYTTKKPSDQALRYARCMFRPTAAIFGGFALYLEVTADTHSVHSTSEVLSPSMRRTHLFLSSPMYTCRANSAKTMRQKMVSVITSANCLNECSSALMMVFRPVGKKQETPCTQRLTAHLDQLRTQSRIHNAVLISSFHTHWLLQLSPTSPIRNYTLTYIITYEQALVLCVILSNN